MTTNPNDFLITKEYRRFIEFCDAVRKYKYIGVCYGPPGVGKTLSARHYSKWGLLENWIPRSQLGAIKPPVDRLEEYRCLFYTVPVAVIPGEISSSLSRRWDDLNMFVESEKALQEERRVNLKPNLVELIIVDEADRLKPSGIEQVREVYDALGIGVILIGMPGVEKKLSRYPQFYSRVGFVHQYRQLSNEEMKFILEKKWSQLSQTLNVDDFTDMEAVSAIIRITNGNFRVLQRLFSQIERIMQINDVKTITKEVIETARESLVLGVHH